ncbi:MAG: stalk domain-containing protein, partial [Eubacteriales bacterium]
MQKALKVLAALALVLCMTIPFAAFAADDDIAVDLGDKLSFRSIDASYADGVLTLASINGVTEKKESPAIFFPGVSVDTQEYRYIKVEMKTDVQTTEKSLAHSFYFHTDTSTAFSESKKVAVSLTAKSDGYEEYTFDMAKNGDWSGTVTGIFYSLNGNVTGSASIKSIRFVKGEPIKKIVLTAEEVITDIPAETVSAPVSKFAKTRDYANRFTDVSIKDWYYSAVSSAYEFALVNGDSETTYNPEGTMTVAEAVTLAARMHSIQVGDGEAAKIAALSSGETWYSNYVDYAKKQGFLKDGAFDSYDRPITRAEMVSLFAAALGKECFATLNYVTHIPDVAADASYADAVYMFYNAGICMGNDIYGTFNPDSNITRSEVAAIVDRIADLDHRLDKDLAVHVNPESAYWIVDDSDYSTRNSVSHTLQSGWDYDIRGAMVKDDDEPPYTLADISDTEPVTLTRTLTVQDAGIVTTDLGSVKFNSAIDGWYMETNSSSGLPVYRIFTKNGEFWVVDNGVEKSTGVKPAVAVGTRIVVTADIAARTYHVNINNADCGTYAFANASAADIAQFRTGTTAEAVMDTTIGTLKMYCNYLVNEYIGANAIPYTWKAEQTGDMTVSASGGEFVFDGNTGKASLSKDFTATSGKIAAELIMLYPEIADGATFALTSGGTPIVSFTTKDGKMYANGTELREYKGYMWYMVRLIADTDKQTAEIKVSGKTVAENIPFAAAASALDGILISSENNGGKKLRIDDITVQKLPVYDNYPSEPVVPEGADDYYIGMNVCNLWRNGYHWGWDNISPYDDNRPVLGWYDEGLPEVADWEIKFMVEHGVDFQLLCWYHSGESPMKTFYGSTPKALFQGFMNAEYSDEYGKFALLWEAANGQKPQNLDDFKARFVDFWVEYFFTDPRYMTIDNKLVMSIFGPEHLKNAFGSAAGVKEAFDYLRGRVRELGYDDIIIMACNGSSDASTLQSLADMGIDAVHAYNWGTAGASAAWNQKMISDQQKLSETLHNVPTVSTGFNNLAWAYTRHDQLTTENMKQVLTWIRDYALDKYTVTGEDDAWKSKFIMLSTWNEYGEGTYMMPAGLNGFGYLDTVREVFTKGGKHTDEQPDNLQQARLQHLYPLNREIIRPDGYYKRPEYKDVLFEEKFADNGTVLWSNANSTVSAEGDILVGTGTNSDPILFSKMPNGPLNANEVKQIKVWVDGPVGNSVEVYFLTDKDSSWTANKGASARITQEGMNPVLVDLSNVATWQGTITALRIDPITSQNSFRVEKVQFIGEIQTEMLQFNGEEITFDMMPITLEDDMLIPFFPDTGIGYRLGVAYTWDKVNKKLTLAKNGHEIVFTMGSKLIAVDGEPVIKSYAPYLEDGIPMVPLHLIIDTFGYKTETKTVDGISVFNVITLPDDLYEVVNSRVANQWEFNITGDAEGWSLASATATVIDGSFYGNDMNLQTGWNGRYDPALSSPTISIAANRYKTLKIRMKHKIQAEKTDENKGEFQLVVYFASSAGGLSEGRTYRAALEQTSNDEYIEYTFNLADNADWIGSISKIRVDPFNNVPGEFWIDYIRFE